MSFVTASFAIVVTRLLVPPEHTSPVKAGIVVTVEALPFKHAVIIFAQKFLLASRQTIVLAVFTFVAVVAELATQFAVVICANLMFSIEPASIAFVTTPFAIVVALVVPEEVTWPVKAGIVVTVEALPAKHAVIVPAEKFLLASRQTIVLALFNFVAVVAELATQFAVVICANLMFAIEPASIAFVTAPFAIVVTRLLAPVEVTLPVKAGIVVTVVALPVKFAVIVPAEKLPSASRATIVLACIYICGCCSRISYTICGDNLC
jgi:hypothetical protein